MTDGWDWRQPGVGGAPAGHPTAGHPPAGGPATPQDSGHAGSPWWSDALADPWRDPHAPAAVVLPAAPVVGSEPEPVVDPDAAGRPRLQQLLLIPLVTALLAGALGGALGYAFAIRGGAGATVLGAVPGAAPTLAQRPPESLAGVAERVLPSVVTVRVAGLGGTSEGSGFIASADGHVITNDHVVAGGTGKASVIFNDGSSASATVVGQDAESDIAVIKVSRTGLRPVEFGDSDALAVGDPVLAMGSPLSLANTVTAGIVSALDRTMHAGEPGGPTRYYAAIQTDAAVNHGNSGGPLVDAAGRVIGVNSTIKSLVAEGQEAGNIGLAFAIPINQAKRITQDIIGTGKARRTVIGAQVGGPGSGTNGAGVRLATVEPSGPAAGAGLRAGDVILKLNGRPMTEPTDLIALVRKYAPGSVVTVEYRRGSTRQNASVTLAADAK
ncbi:PDZ domain-containing protein [Verrucosispora sp. CWR15]|uniref:PDZ domain-containing protein n=1 Tax=Verrucosispora sioxanthis TaxID=2499994 RepID=A0A6M1L274_9ACTN|nr:trypsin-like peptidase domain-containing protein [Verrucosispora sioxanthis]NEE63247.1 PDZ domain-containing protein [Verrucosispora sioxanthis]NGM12357.1 PDZ domain-containing protein [Verrucosispora sioxanthis]